MANGEVGMYLPKVRSGVVNLNNQPIQNQTMLSILERSNTMQKSSTRASRSRSHRKGLVY